MTTNDNLNQLVQAHQLRPEHVAIMLDRSTYTVRQWLSGNWVMPDNMLRLLKYEIQSKQEGTTHEP